MEKVIIRHANDVPPVDCPCGKSIRIITSKDTEKLGIHRTFITDSQKHYHKKTTEVYYILEGFGTIELDDQVVDLSPGLVIYIPPGVHHKVSGDIKTLITTVPAFNDKDEYIVEV